MTKAPSDLQELRRRIYRKAKSETTHRFWGLFVHITKIETLEEAYRIAKSNGGAPGIDGQKFQDIETAGRAAFLAAVREDLVTGRYKPKPNRRVEIPKGNGKFRNPPAAFRSAGISGIRALKEYPYARLVDGSPLVQQRPGSLAAVRKTWAQSQGA